MSNLPNFFHLSVFLIAISTTTVQAAVNNPDTLSHRMGSLTIKTHPGALVEIEQQSHEFWFGAAISNKIFENGYSQQDITKYKQVFLENFNSAVTENALKWMAMQPTKDAPDYSVVDAILEWTDANDLPLRGHNIFWGVHKFVQDWVKDLDKERLHATLEARARDIGSRYKGRFAQYDLNNEMIHKNYYAEQLGDGITLEMANWVKQEDPDAKLYLNDYDILTGSRLDDYIQHIRDLLDMGVPLAGIGVQGHLHTDTFDPAQLKHALDELAKFDLPIVITEFNMPGQRSKYYQEKGRHKPAPEDRQKFAKELQDYYRICFAHPAVEGILMWGFWERANWIPESSMYDADWNPTPLAQAYRNLVFGEWWTTASVKADAEGNVIIPAFYGDYVIRTNGKEKRVSLGSGTGKKLVMMN